LWFHDDEWDYDTPALAFAAAQGWDPAATPEPAGWMRHPSSGRRRPDGDPTREYVRP